MEPKAPPPPINVGMSAEVKSGGWPSHRAVPTLPNPNVGLKTGRPTTNTPGGVRMNPVVPTTLGRWLIVGVALVSFLLLFALVLSLGLAAPAWLPYLLLFVLAFGLLIG